MLRVSATEALYERFSQARPACFRFKLHEVLELNCSSVGKAISNAAARGEQRGPLEKLGEALAPRHEKLQVSPPACQRTLPNSSLLLLQDWLPVSECPLAPEALCQAAAHGHPQRIDFWQEESSLATPQPMFGVIDGT
jgi:hypothetical protein